MRSCASGRTRVRGARPNLFGWSNIWDSSLPNSCLSSGKLSGRVSTMLGWMLRNKCSLGARKSWVLGIEENSCIAESRERREEEGVKSWQSATQFVGSSSSRLQRRHSLLQVEEVGSSRLGRPYSCRMLGALLFLKELRRDCIVLLIVVFKETRWVVDLILVDEIEQGYVLRTVERPFAGFS